MERYIVHLHNKGFVAKDAEELLQKARTLVDYDVIIRDTRVSSKHVEFDTTISASKLTYLLEKLSEIAPVASYTQITEKRVEKEHAIENAKLLFNDERYWECHEALEGVWKNTTGKEKELLQGLILTCAAFVHSQKDEDDICISILNRALARLNDARGIYYGIDTDRFKQAVADMLTTKRIQYFKI
jgi:hypothetical protein